MITGLQPRNFTWIIKDRLAVSDRIGGYGFQHRRVRREEEIHWLVNEAGITAVLTLVPGNQNHNAYREAGLETQSVPLAGIVGIGQARKVYDALDEMLTDRAAKVLVHREIIDDGVGGLLGGYLLASGLVTDRILATALIQEILGRALGPEARALLAVT